MLIRSLSHVVAQVSFIYRSRYGDDSIIIIQSIIDATKANVDHVGLGQQVSLCWADQNLHFLPIIVYGK